MNSVAPRTGYCRALLCKIDDAGVLRVSQLTNDHDLSNDLELQRLLELGLDTEKLKQTGKLGDYQHTRSIGDYNVKSGYKEIEILSGSKSEPDIAIPEVEVVEIDDSCKFLILMSNGLHKSLELATGTEHVNRDIASMVASEFSAQTTLSGVVQAVVDRVVRLHHDTYLVNVGQRKDMCQSREDITLMVRNFNYVFPNAANSPTGASSSSGSPFTNRDISSQVLTPLSLVIPPGSNSPAISPPQLQLAMCNPTALYQTNSRTIMSTNHSTLSSSGHRSYTNTSSNDSTQSDDPQFQKSRNTHQHPAIPLDEHGKVEAYVDFTMFFEAFEKLSVEEQKEVEAELEPRPAYETIPEEKELECDGEDLSEEELDGISMSTFEHPGTEFFS